VLAEAIVDLLAVEVLMAAEGAVEGFLHEVNVLSAGGVLEWLVV
jgi:hypothetical protein